MFMRTERMTIEGMMMMLTTADVEAYVASLVFLPGWTFGTIEPFGREDSMRLVTVNCAIANTSYPPQYNVPLAHGFSTEVVIDCREGVDLDDVGHKILTACVALMLDRETIEHECREFFRTDRGESYGVGTDRWHAQFHPHRLSGDRAWNARSAAYGIVSSY